MTGNIALDVAIGLVFVYCLYSLLTTTITEFIAIIFQMRARNLKKAIARMLDDENSSFLSAKFYATPLIKYLSRGRIFKIFGIYSKPSNIQPEIFSQALIYLLKEDKQEGMDPVTTIKNKLELLDGGRNSETKKYLLFLLNEANGDIEKFTKSVEKWFDATMERCTGWYKKNMSFITLFLALFIATVFNVDSFRIIGALSTDSKARDQYVQMAGQLIQNPLFTEPTPVFDTTLYNRLLTDPNLMQKAGNDSVKLEKLAADSATSHLLTTQKVLLARMDTLYKLSEQPRKILSFERTDKLCCIWWYYNFTNFLGCLVTAIALTLGAPFWFDLLNKLMKLRSSISVGKAPENSEKTGSGSKQKPAVG